MSEIYDNGASLLAERAYNLYTKEVGTLQQVDSIKAKGLFAGIAKRRKQANAAINVQSALQSAKKAFGPNGYHNAALVEWAYELAQEKAAAKAEVARKQAEFDAINSLFNAAIETPDSTYNRRSESVRCEEPYLPRHARTYFIDVETEQVRFGDNSLERIEITDGFTSVKITGQVNTGSEVVSFESSPTTGFVGQRSVADSTNVTPIDFAAFNAQYAPQLLPASA